MLFFFSIILVQQGKLKRLLLLHQISKAYNKPILRLSAEIFVLSLLSHWKIGKK